MDAAPRHVYEACGLHPLAQVREYYSAVRLIAHALDLRALYGLSEFDLREHWEEPGELSPLGFCDALAIKRGFRIARGKGGADTHRAGLEVLRDCVDGLLCLSFAPPSPPTAPSPAVELD